MLKYSLEKSSVFRCHCISMTNYCNSISLTVYRMSVILSVLSASFYGDGFVQLKVKESTHSSINSLRIRFRTSSQRGVLFLAAGQTDYLLLELSSGRLQASYEHVCHHNEHVIQCVWGSLYWNTKIHTTGSFSSSISSAVELNDTWYAGFKLSVMMESVLQIWKYIILVHNIYSK